MKNDKCFYLYLTIAPFFKRQFAVSLLISIAYSGIINRLVDKIILVYP